MRLVLMLALVGCAAPEPSIRPPVDSTLTVTETPRVSVERALEHVDTAALTDDLVLWFSSDGDLYRAAPGESPVLIEIALDASVDAAASLSAVGSDDLELVVLDGFAFTWDGVLLQPSSIDDTLSGTLRRVHGETGRLWLETSAGLYRWDSDGIVEIRVDDQPVTRGFATGGVALGLPVVWVATDTALHAVPIAGGRVLVTHEVVVDGLAADRYGLTWVLRDGALWRLSREGALVDIGRTGVHTLVSDPDEPYLWLGADDGWWRVQGLLAAQLTTEPAGSPISLDAAGRLWVHDGDALDIVAVERPIVITGLGRNNTLDLESEIAIHPTDAEDVSAVAVQLDNSLIDVSATRTFTLDPATLAGGLHQLSVEVAWLDGEVRAIDRPIFVGLPFDVTWSEHIRPLHEARCARCHEDGTETVLNDSASWSTRYSDILQQVESGAMPLTDTPLSPDELALVVGWGNGGFLQ